MTDLLQIKSMQCPAFKHELIQSKNSTLIEDTAHAFWGRGKHNQGKNKLGELAEELRSKLQNGITTFEPRPSTWSEKMQMMTQESNQMRHTTLQQSIPPIASVSSWPPLPSSQGHIYQGSNKNMSSQDRHFSGQTHWMQQSPMSDRPQNQRDHREHHTPHNPHNNDGRTSGENRLTNYEPYFQQGDINAINQSHHWNNDDPCYGQQNVPHTWNTSNQVTRYGNSNGNALRWDSTCWYCGEGGHTTRSCRHGKPITCNRCGNYGHNIRLNTIKPTRILAMKSQPANQHFQVLQPQTKI